MKIINKYIFVAHVAITIIALCWYSILVDWVAKETFKPAPKPEIGITLEQVQAKKIITLETSLAATQKRLTDISRGKKREKTLYQIKNYAPKPTRTTKHLTALSNPTTGYHSKSQAKSRYRTGLPIKFPPNVERWRAEVSKYSWNPDEALLTIYCESGGNPKAVSSTDDWGLFQLHNGDQYWGVERMFNPAQNIWLAYYKKYLGHGWSPWCAVEGVLH